MVSDEKTENHFQIEPNKACDSSSATQIKRTKFPKKIKKQHEIVDLFHRQSNKKITKQMLMKNLATVKAELAKLRNQN